MTPDRKEKVLVYGADQRGKALMGVPQGGDQDLGRGFHYGSVWQKKRVRRPIRPRQTYRYHTRSMGAEPTPGAAAP